MDEMRENNTLDSRDFDAEVKEIIEMVTERRYSKVRSTLIENNAVDIAEILEEIDEELGLEREILVFRMLPKDVSADVFSFLSEDNQVDIINGITQKETDQIIQELAFDDMIDLLEELPANLVDKILVKTTKEERSLINTFLNYPENSAGSLMTIDYVHLKKDMKVSECLQHIKDVGEDAETVYSCYVIGEGRHLIGIVSLKNLVMSDPDTVVSTIMHADVMSVSVLTDQEEVSNMFKKYGLIAMPVVDREGRLVGIITVDDILEVIDDEATEDFQRMAGVTGDSDDEYLEMTVFQHVKTRLPWLFILMCSYMITGGIIARFEDMLSACISLVTYMPMLMGTGGNSGSQSSTLIIRGLATEDVHLDDTLKVLWKEVRIGLIVGLCLSALNFLRIIYIDHDTPGVALTVCGAMFLIVMIAKCVGAMLPLLAKAVHIDPALMAGPVVSSLTDMMSLGIYFVFATIVLGIGQ
ncbi:MAG: magnesium transporter [Anaerovoracaceae bacterium]|nr:magnesium transporter [Bacillota bacterium]MDY2670406.1 magnesium transporter [Anaerovoracaceae bacterium]